jgi:general secretion pathway protein D
MRTKTVIMLVLGCLLGVAVGASLAQSLADLAREEKARRGSQPEAVKVYTNDTIAGAIAPEKKTPPAPAVGSASAGPSSTEFAARETQHGGSAAVAEQSKAPQPDKQPDSSRKTGEKGQSLLAAADASLAKAMGAPEPPQSVTGAVASGPVTVSGIAIQTGPAGETVVNVATSGPVTYRTLELDGPHRLVVDLQGAQKATPQESYPANSPVLRQVRVGQFSAKDPAIVRVVADLSGDPIFSVRATPVGIRIELKPRFPVLSSAAPAASQGAQTPTPAQAPTPAQQPAAPPPVAPSQPSPAPAQAQPVQVPSVPASSNAFYQLSPFRSLSQNERLLDSLGLRIVLSYDYRKGGAEEAAWKTKGAPGVEANRLFLKPLGAGSYRTIEMAITPAPQGGYELAVYGQQVTQAAKGANPDLPVIQQLVSQEVIRMQQAPPPPLDARQLSYETYYLSYVGADRALALLKTMGYTTVEYNQQAGESLYENIYNPIKLGSGHPPIIVKLIDSAKTSLMEPAPSPTAVPGQVMAPQPVQPGVVGPSYSGVPAIGGTFLSYMTSGEPQQRLLILYNKDDPDSLQSLINLLQSTVDVPSREIMIEALVIELNSTRARDLGVTFESQQNKASLYSVDTDATTGAALPFVFSFDKDAPRLATFKASLSALLKTGEAEVLSNPSVLVLDDRQARIQIGQQVPVVKSVSTQAGIISSVDYFPVGIVLNLRPRISQDGSEITMQTETIVSAVATGAEVAGTTALVAPVVNNRQVQSIVRVADNTPFIIGGLISNNNETSMSGIPLLSQIPGLGALFRRTTVSKVKQEVIIVVTPHVVPLQDKYFSYVIPKDSDQFERFNYRLFRNAYRIRGRDLYDLEFVYDSNVYKGLVSRVTAASARAPELRKEEPFASVLKGDVPGEDVLVRRMLWEIVDRTRFARYINPERIIFFENNPSAVGGSGFQLAFLSQKLKELKGGQNGLALTFEASPRGTEERPFVPPKAVASYLEVIAQDYPRLLIDGNAPNPDGTPRNWMVLLSKDYSGIRVSPLELLQGVLVLRKVLELNRSMPLTIKELHIGRQIMFPSQEELQQGYQLVDREAAKLFYEVYNYYPVFEQKFNRETRQMNARLEKISQQ